MIFNLKTIARTLIAVCAIVLGTADCSAFSVLHQFDPSVDGGQPKSFMVNGNTLVGTARVGGQFGSGFSGGTIWSYDTQIGEFTKLHDFREDSDGQGPVGELAARGSKLFGTTSGGSAPGGGTLWSHDLATNQFDNLHDFEEGDYPQGGVVVMDDLIIGTTNLGGNSDEGSLWSYQIDTSSFSKLHDFVEATDGRRPYSIAVKSSIVYGVSLNAGKHDRGTLWSFDMDQGMFTNLRDFSTANDEPTDIVLKGNTILGVSFGGLSNDGTLWSFDTENSTFVTLHDFEGESDGQNPTEITISGDIVYGITNTGGPIEGGTAWAYDLDSYAFSTLHEFGIVNNGTGSGEIAVSQGIVYGTSSLSGELGGGTLWLIPEPTTGLPVLVAGFLLFARARRR